MAGEVEISMVLTTDATPSMAISVSPNVLQRIERKTAGLIETAKTAEGNNMLEGTKLNPFKKNSNLEYFGVSELLVEQ